MSKKEEFTFEELLKISVSKTEKSKQVIHVIKWGDNAPVLEKRGYYLDKNGEWQFAKASGFTLKDFKKILKHKNEIKELLSGEENEDD